jgi:hypothetical protein
MWFNRRSELASAAKVMQTVERGSPDRAAIHTGKRSPRSFFMNDTLYPHAQRTSHRYYKGRHNGVSTRIHSRELAPLLLPIWMVCLILFSAKAHGSGPQLKVLYSFGGGTDGEHPYAGLVADAAGNLYGTTPNGGGQGCSIGGGCGIVFELSPPTSGDPAWSENVLYRFTGGSDGSTPYAKLVMDQLGNLYGTTYYGGQVGNSLCLDNGGEPIGCGVIFELSPPETKGGPWIEKVVHDFTGPEGAFPYASLVFDTLGNLYGTTSGGGSPLSGCVISTLIGCGVVFEVTPPSNQGGVWTLTDLYQFVGAEDGGFPYAEVAFDEEQNLYGTTCVAGISDGGVVFQLVPQGNGLWVETAIASFPNGACPRAPVLIDSAGNLYSTTSGGAGSAFELSPAGAGAWTLTTLWVFGSTNGMPFSGLTPDSNGNLYGTTHGAICGSVYQLRKQGLTWKEAQLNLFNLATEPCAPFGPVIFGKGGVLYGTSYTGGASRCGSSRCGTTFAIRP